MNVNLVNEYFAIADKGVPFEDPRLAALRERMSDRECELVVTKLRASAEAVAKEADALQAKLGVNVNQEGKGPQP